MLEVSHAMTSRATFAGTASVAIAATGMIYRSYLVADLALLQARLKDWPRAPAPFSLGRFGIPTTLLALAWAAASSSTSPGRERRGTRPRSRPG